MIFPSVYPISFVGYGVSMPIKLINIIGVNYVFGPDQYSGIPENLSYHFRSVRTYDRYSWIVLNDFQKEIDQLHFFLVFMMLAVSFVEFCF